MPTLYAKNLAYKWDAEEQNIFGPVSLTIKGGQITALLGANGTGKSTLLNVIGCRLRPTSGSVIVDGSPGEQKDFNYMLQHPDRLLFRHLTIHQNLRLTRKKNALSGLTEEHISAFFRDRDILLRYPWQCSVGQRQRAVLLRTILDIPSFQITLLDEAFASISRDSKKSIYEHIRAVVTGDSKALVFVTHDISEACMLADNVVVLSDGKCSTFDVSEVGDEKDFLEATTLLKDIQNSLLVDSITQPENGDRCE